MKESLEKLKKLHKKIINKKKELLIRRLDKKFIEFSINELFSFKLAICVSQYEDLINLILNSDFIRVLNSKHSINNQDGLYEIEVFIDAYNKLILTYDNFQNIILSIQHKMDNTLEIKNHLGKSTWIRS